MRDTGVELTECDREPIHIPGSIQPHGALLALAGDAVAQASANAHDWLGAAPEALLGRSLAEVFGPEGAARIRQALELDDPRAANPVRLEAGGRALDGLVHRHDGVDVIEVEAAAEQTPDEARASLAAFRHGLVEVQKARSVRSLCDSIARSVRELTGYDRVLVYRFHADWHGEVVAEARDESLEPFLELHYPASDIPAQARALYRLNWLRNIPDREYRPVPLVPAAHPRTGRPLDMGLAALRSVAPVHVQYLRNMGVAGTLTISLLRDGELWGLIACHHNTPRALPYELRASCELLGQLFSARIGAAEAEEHRDADLRRAETLAALTDRLAGTRDWAGELARDPALLQLVGASGAAIVAEGRVETAGDAPTPRAIQVLAARLAGHPLPGGLVATDHARDELPGAEASGVLAVPLSDTRLQWIVWFRPEVVQSVNWAGDPRKPMEPVADGAMEVRLTPRGSFALWKETVRGHSVPWTAGDRRAALDLRRVVAEVVLRHAEEIAALNRALARSNAELDAFTYIASHDLREPLRGIRNYADMLREDYAGRLDAEGTGMLDTLTRLTMRMDGLIESLFEYSRVGRLEMEFAPTDLNAVIDDVLHSLAHQLREAGVEIRVPRPLPTLPCDPVRVGQVFQNLVHNAVKYNDRPDRWVEIGWREGTPPVLYVRDNGIGIPARHHEVIFRIYKRLHARDRFGGGTGVGLTIVRRIVERHGGRVWLESAPESGTTFFFTLQPD